METNVALFCALLFNLLECNLLVYAVCPVLLTSGVAIPSNRAATPRRVRYFGLKGRLF
ncbi:hypothetical protein DL98DRAFT_511392 [Cadophora sp. DSE1049]|nr:hypothetical protein DL98DRAFT_511392 [Cadophora sp. DSE1049]